MPRSDRPRATRGALVWAAILILYVVWGSTYLGIAVAIESIPPFLMAGSRFLLAAALMLGWVAIRDRGAIRLPTLREWRDTAIVGALLMGGGMGMVAWGEQTVPSGIAAVLIAMMPVWVAILGRIFLGERLPRLAATGIALGFVGVAILVGPSLAGVGNLDPAGTLALIISPMSWATGSLFAANRARLPRDPLVATATQMLTGGVVLCVMATLAGEPARFDPAAVTDRSILAFAYLVLIGSLVAFTAYAWLLHHAPLPLIATYAFVNPVVAVLLGAVVLSEAITPGQLLAGGVIVVGVALIVAARGRMTTAGRQDARAPAPEGATPA